MDQIISKQKMSSTYESSLFFANALPEWDFR